MGDVAMTVPVLKSLVKQYPNVKLTILSRPFFEPLFINIPNVAFVAVDLKNRHKGLSGIFSLYFELRKFNFDAVADLHSVLRSHILRSLCRFSGKIVAKIDKGRAEKKALTRAENKVFKQLKATPERYADVFRELGFDLKLESIVKTNASSNEPLKIGIAPFAQHAAKQYPLALMHEVVNSLSKKYDVYLFGGGEKEKAVLSSWSNEHLPPDPQLHMPTQRRGNIFSTVGKQTFAEELKLISTLDLMISMDSGNGHLAANYGVKVLTIWGLTHPYAGFAPYGSSKKNWLLPDLKKYPKIPTSIYGNNLPTGYETAMTSIPPKVILEKVEELLGKEN